MRDDSGIGKTMAVMIAGTAWGAHMGYQLAYDHKDKRTIGAVVGGIVGYLALVTLKRHMQSQGEPVPSPRLNPRPIQVIGR